MDYQKKAEEILVSVYHGEAIDYKYDLPEVNLLAAALEQAYKEGVEKGVRINTRMSELKSWGHDGSRPKCGACEEYNGLAARLLSPAKG